MATDMTIIEARLQAVPSGLSESILQCVQSQERLERLTATVIYSLVVGVPFLVGFARSGEITFGILFNTAMWYIAARLFIRAVRGLVLQPSRRIRYDRAATKLRNCLHASDELAVGPYSWTHGSPGALGMSKAGEITLADRTTGYQLLRILPQ